MVNSTAERVTPVDAHADAEQMSARHSAMQAAIERAFLIRSFEQRILKLFSEGQIFGTVHTCIGQEFTGIAVATHLQPGDLLFSNHRCHGHYLARTGDVAGLMAEIMGRATGVCGGRGGSQHICGDGFFSNGVQGGIAPVAAGLALAQRYRNTQNIVVVFIGDGTLGEGVLYETLNLVSKWSLPMLFLLENNGYSQSTPATQTVAGDILERAQAFRIRTCHANSWAPEDLIDSVGEIIGQVRAQSCPAFVRVDTYRLMAHSKGDDDRSADERQHYWAIDPLTRFEERNPEEAASFREDAETKISAAVEAAIQAPFTHSGTEERNDSPSVVWQRTSIPGRRRVVTRIYDALRDQMENDERTILLGEDIEAPYGGAFKVTGNLSSLFPLRVHNTPLSEAAIVGVASGLAMAGMRPVCEIMFGDFLTLAADQIINHAAKFQWMYNDKVTVPLVIRTPMGGRRGYGATHSQCLEKHFLGIPGTWVLALHHRYDPCLVYQRLFATNDRPTLVIENKVLYGEFVTDETIEGFWCEHSGDDFPTTRVRSSARADITIACYGGILREAEKAVDCLFEEHEIVAEIICPTRIYPLRLEPFLQSAKISGRLLVVEEGQLFCGFGAELLAAIHERSPGSHLLTRRLGASEHPIPACKAAENESLPNSGSIVRTCLEMVGRA